RGVRDGSLKYVEAPDASHSKLYDLANDPNESRDLAPERAADVRRLAAETTRLGGPAPVPPTLSSADAAIVAGLGLSTVAPKSQPILPAEMVAVGNAALKAHHSFQRQMLQAAAFLFSDVLRQDPANHMTLLDIGSMYFNMRNAAQSQAAFLRA